MLALHRVLNKSLILSNAGAVNAARTVAYKIIPIPPTPDESYDEKNLRLKRELSPHLSIYQPQITTILSITHRITGVALVGYSTIFGIGALVSPVDFSHYVTMIEGLQLGGGTLAALKFLLAFPFAYHTANGVRHLVWDMGKCLKMKDVYTTGYAMVGSSVVLSAILALL